MINIPITTEIHDFVAEQAPRFNIGGISNLNEKDLVKADREEFQFTGLFGESAWYRHRYGVDGLSMLRKLLDFKYSHFTNTGKGDDGEDDVITYRGKRRNLDIKTSHIKSVDGVNKMNLVVAPRELHKDMVYVAAFAIGPDRRNVSQVVLSGWCLNEDLKKKFYLDPVKFAVKVPMLTPIERLAKYF